MTQADRLKERHEARDKVRALVDAGVKCTLDGQPAVIRGFQSDFGKVGEVNDHIREAEWSWPAILGVLTQHGGNFKTQ
jgi:hypothetical protein